MKRNHVIVLAIAAMLALWMFSKSGNASTAISEAVSSNQLSSETTILIDS